MGNEVLNIAGKSNMYNKRGHNQASLYAIEQLRDSRRKYDIHGNLEDLWGKLLTEKTNELLHGDWSVQGYIEVPWRA